MKISKYYSFGASILSAAVIMIAACKTPPGPGPGGSKVQCRADVEAAAKVRLLEKAEEADKAENSGVVTQKISGFNFSNKEITAYHDKELGLTLFEGDIVVGDDRPAASAIFRRGTRFRWPDGKMPYLISDSIPSGQKSDIESAIVHWNANTMIELRPRTSERNYVHFVRGPDEDHCSSAVGMVGGRQKITLSRFCGRGSIIHEIGHAVGLWHEQSRSDRDKHICILWDKIDPKFAHNFDQHINNGVDVGKYDFESIMHYQDTAFSVDGSKTIVARKGSVTLGQRKGLSRGDIAAVNKIYGSN